MSTLNYSKWDHIEVSDDEDDTHPNIDTPSLFRWRHQARVEREEQHKKEKDKVTTEAGSCRSKLEKLKESMEKIKLSNAEEGKERKIAEIQRTIEELQKQDREWTAKEKELTKIEKSTPWNVDSLSQEKWAKTHINKYSSDSNKHPSEMTDYEREKHHKEFVKANGKLIKKFGMMKKWEDSCEFLLNNLQLVCEETANYLVIWCIDLQVEKKHSLMHQVAHQTIVMQFILELAKTTKDDPRACVRPFFTRIKKAEKQYTDAFEDELESFKQRIMARAKARYEAALAEAEEELEKERQARLGPGGLDPVEVFESLPEELQKCFESKNLELLQEVLAKMDQNEAAYHIKRCVDSGMWVPGGGEEGQDEGQGATSTPE